MGWMLNMLTAVVSPKEEQFSENVRCNPSHSFWENIITLKAVFWRNTLCTSWGTNSLWALSATCSCRVTASCIWERLSSRYPCFSSTSVTFLPRSLQRNRDVCKAVRPCWCYWYRNCFLISQFLLSIYPKDVKYKFLEEVIQWLKFLCLSDLLLADQLALKMFTLFPAYKTNLAVWKYSLLHS